MTRDFWADYEASLAAEMRLRRDCESVRTSQCPTVDAGPRVFDPSGSWVDRLNVYLRYLGSDEETLRVGDDLAKCLGGTIEGRDRVVGEMAYLRKELDRIRAAIARFRTRLSHAPAWSVPDDSSRTVHGPARPSREYESLKREIELHTRIERDYVASMAQLENGHCIGVSFSIAIPGLNKARCEPIAVELRKDRRFKYVLCTHHTVVLKATGR
jgi:hypothetical protein